MIKQTELENFHIEEGSETDILMNKFLATFRKYYEKEEYFNLFFNNSENIIRFKNELFKVYSFCLKYKIHKESIFLKNFRENEFLTNFLNNFTGSHSENDTNKQELEN